jgi:hypothetical protein
MFAVLGPVSLLLALEADPIVEVEGASTCPTPDAITRHLDRLLLRSADAGEADRLSVEPASGAIRIELRRHDGTIVGEKYLELLGSCDELAEAVAIVVAIWERPLRPGSVPPLEVRIQSAADQGQAMRREDGPDSHARSTDRVVPVADHAEGVHGRGTGASEWRFEGGVGVEGLVPGWVPAAVVEGVVRNTPGNWGGRLAMTGAWWRASPLGSGRASWTRLSAQLGLIHGWSDASWFVDLHEQLVGGAFVARGNGFDDNRTRVGFDPGIGAGLRGGIQVGPLLRVWLDAGIALWPMRQKMQVKVLEAGAGADGVDAPLVEGSLTLGATFLTSR